MRFVIHHHLAEKEHYDFMIETKENEMLTTWRIALSDLDLLQKGAEVKAQRIQNHKKFFLDYEGPLSSGKGSIIIFDSGFCKINLKAGNRFECEISGEIFKGIIRITPAENGFSYIRHSTR
jgi:hypothetical protein